jgi:hypothetical protein
MLECAAHVVQLVPDFQCSIFCICQLRNKLRDSDFAFWGTETPFEDTQESFLGLMECFAKKADTDEFHPLNYQQLKNAQDKDKLSRKS